jgi:Amt family ammonium transporter
LFRGADVDIGTLAAVAATNTTIAAAVGGITCVLTALFLEERRTGECAFSLTAAMNGVLSGLVAITAGCGTVESWAAAVIGLVAGWLYLASSALLIRWKIDDVVDAIPVHLVAGVWGVVATGLFTSPARLQAAFLMDEHVGWFYSWGRGSADASLLLSQIVGILFILGWTLALMLPFFYVLNYRSVLRADPFEELVGMDAAYHGGAHAEDTTAASSKKQLGFIRGLLNEPSSANDKK